MSIVCRSCGSTQLEPVLSLGSTPLANSLLTDETLAQPEPRYPLELVFCGECTLVQITLSVPPEDMFEEYAVLLVVRGHGRRERACDLDPPHRGTEAGSQRPRDGDREQRRLSPA